LELTIFIALDTILKTKKRIQKRIIRTKGEDHIMSYIASWSGGKDSCFACYRAILEGYDVSHLVNFTSREHKKVSFHGTEMGLIQLQAEAIGIPLLQKETTWETYE
jgi:hypothetical protein